MYSWLFFVALTIVCWGLYGNLLHSGSQGLGAGSVPVLRMKAFLWVGVAYFIIAVVAPIIWIVKSGEGWTMQTKGIWWSLAAGVAGAVGALGVLLALGAAQAAKVASAPVVVMSLVFAGAPVMAGIHSFLAHPPKGGLKEVNPMFFVGMALAVAGGFLVARYKPAAAPPAKPAPAVPAASAASASAVVEPHGIDGKTYFVS